MRTVRTVRTLVLLLLSAVLVISQERQGAGVVLVKISSVLNPEGRDAAGSCCSEDGGDIRKGRGRGGVCPGPCYTMLRVCANRVSNSSQLLVHGPVRDWDSGGGGAGKPLGEGRPLGGGRNPIDVGRKPVHGGRNPSDGGRNPIDGGRNPIDDGRNPIHGGRNPIDSVRNSIDGGSQSQGGGRRPHENGAQPQGGGGSPLGEGGQPPPGDRRKQTEVVLGRPQPGRWTPPPPGPRPQRPTQGPPGPVRRRPFHQGNRPPAPQVSLPSLPSLPSLSSLPSLPSLSSLSSSSYFPTFGLKPSKPRQPQPPPHRQYRPEGRKSTLRDREIAFWEPEEYTVMWREERTSRALLMPDTHCTYGSLNTEVIFNNSLENQGDLLVKLPFTQAWPGIFELTIEAWHIRNPRNIPQPRPVQARVKHVEKSIFASILETISDTLTKTVENIEKQKLEEDGEVTEVVSTTTTKVPEVTTTTSTSTTTVSDTTTTETVPETSTHYVGGGRRQDEVTEPEVVTEQLVARRRNANIDRAELEGGKEGEIKEEKEKEEEKKKEEEVEEEEEFVDYSLEGDWVDLNPHGKLVLRMERDQVVWAGEGWQRNHYISYHARIDYSIKLACAKNYTGPTCSIAKVCLGKVGQQNPRMSCSADGQVVCQPGWQGTLCESPICAPECHATQGYCRNPGECRCKTGYSGSGCSDCVRLLGCVHGTCSQAYECLCKEGYRGLFCSQPVCGEGCSTQNGYCSKPGECRCRSGWEGPHCTECVVRKGCRDGYCTQPGDCVCREGSTGALCDRPVCGGGCHPEHGFCERAGQCFCKVGFQGPNCDECVPYPGCLNGECTGPWTCNCRQGWRGLKCDQLEVADFGPGARDGGCLPQGTFRCMNGGRDHCTFLGNGTTVGLPRCQCQPGFSGEFCQDAENLPALLLPPSKTVSGVREEARRKVSQVIEAFPAFPEKLDNALEKLR